MILGGDHTIEFYHEYLNEVTSPHRAYHSSHIRGRFGHFRHLTYLYSLKIYDEMMAARREASMHPPIVTPTHTHTHTHSNVRGSRI